jgi:hypothetical protein
MRNALLVLAFVTLPLAAAQAQERKIPDDSSRITIPGCSKGRTFIVAHSPGHEPVRSGVEPGRRFRMSGKKELLREIKQQEGSMIEVTGLVRQSELVDQRGVNIGGGVRLGAGPPVAGTGSPIYSDLRYYEVVIDLESWRPLAEPCPRK